MSTDNLHDDAEFERFLAGEGDLAQQLKALPQAEPSAELDAAMLAAISGALASDKVREVETKPASNDPVGPNPVPGMRRRSLAYYWHWPVGVAAGILLTIAYRTAIEPYNPGPVALNDTMQSRVISPTPHVTPPADVTTEPGRVATAPAVIEPPDVAPQPAPPPASAAPAPSIAAVAPAREAAAPAGAPRAQESPVQMVVITGSNVRRADSETASPVQVIAADDLKQSGTTTVSQVLQQHPEPPSGVELAWTHDPAHDVQAAKEAHALARAEPAAEAKADYAALPPPPPRAEPLAPVQAIAMAPRPASAPDARSVAAAPPQPIAATAPAELRASASSQSFGLAGRSGYAADAPKPELGTGLNLTTPPDSRVVAQAYSPDFLAKPAAPQTTREDRLGLSKKMVQADPAHADPRKWLASIEQKMKSKDNTAALTEWDQFIAAYPAYPVKAKLRAGIDALRAKAQAGKPDAGK